MNWLDIHDNWTALAPLAAPLFPQINSVDLTQHSPGTDGFVRALADAHDLTELETRETLDDIVLNAMSRGLVQVSDVTHKMVASS